MAACVKGGPPSLSWNNYNSVLEPPHCHQGDLSKSITDPDLPLVTPQPHLRGSHCPQDKGLGPQLKSEAFQGLGPMGLCSWFPTFGFPTFAHQGLLPAHPLPQLPGQPRSSFKIQIKDHLLSEAFLDAFLSASGL